MKIQAELFVQHNLPIAPRGASLKKPINYDAIIDHTLCIDPLENNKQKSSVSSTRAKEQLCVAPLVLLTGTGEQFRRMHPNAELLPRCIVEIDYARHTAGLVYIHATNEPTGVTSSYFKTSPLTNKGGYPPTERITFRVLPVHGS